MYGWKIAGSIALVFIGLVGCAVAVTRIAAGDAIASSSGALVVAAVLGVIGIICWHKTMENDLVSPLRAKNIELEHALNQWEEYATGLRDQLDSVHDEARMHPTLAPAPIGEAVPEDAARAHEEMLAVVAKIGRMSIDMDHVVSDALANAVSQISHASADMERIVSDALGAAKIVEARFDDLNRGWAALQRDRAALKVEREARDNAVAILQGRLPSPVIAEGPALTAPQVSTIFDHPKTFSASGDPTGITATPSDFNAEIARLFADPMPQPEG